jgi:hypothetical protein
MSEVGHRARLPSGGLGEMTWDALVDSITAHYKDVTLGKMFGMPCLKRANGKVVAWLGNDGGITVKVADEAARVKALALPGASVGSHAFDPRRPMRAWVHLPADQAQFWRNLIERALSA